jgi:hypothetical protein
MSRLGRLCFVVVDSSEIRVQGFAIDGCGNRSSCKELRLDLVDRIVRLDNDTKLGYGRVGKDVNFVAKVANGMKRGNNFDAARATHVERSASGIDEGAKAKGAVRAASEIGLTRIKGYVACLLDKVVDSRVRATIAATSDFRTTIENVLNAQINVVALTQTSNLDAIRETGQGSVRPATSTVLGNVLIEGMGQVAHAIHVAPVKVVRQVFGAKIRVGKGTGVVVQDSVFADLKRQ